MSLPTSGDGILRRGLLPTRLHSRLKLEQPQDNKTSATPHHRTVNPPARDRAAMDKLVWLVQFHVRVRNQSKAELCSISTLNSTPHADTLRSCHGKTQPESAIMVGRILSAWGFLQQQCCCCSPSFRLTVATSRRWSTRQTNRFTTWIGWLGAHLADIVSDFRSDCLHRALASRRVWRQATCSIFWVISENIPAGASCGRASCCSP